MWTSTAVWIQVPAKKSMRFQSDFACERLISSETHYAHCNNGDKGAGQG